ncbi:hypothetical protein E2562_015400 [Oryza meyeriana var. granulata]|uniref:Uncharacterized protein n=1 Tax=Oryza meyeriana var. granulata TaxID=110450 RepID=A0A6G1EK42_9ORYZ|nr:hypothetical protein E2562_015400 [Oryza meyeriana var. granulata]
MAALPSASICVCELSEIAARSSSYEVGDDELVQSNGDLVRGDSAVSRGDARTQFMGDPGAEESWNLHFATLISRTEEPAASEPADSELAGAEESWNLHFSPFGLKK